MKLTKISVKKLFGVFDHEVPLNEGGITIVIGENGLGKTVLLEATSAFFAENFLFFRDLEFQQLSFQFEDQSWDVSKSQTNDRLAMYVTRHLTAKNLKTRSERQEKPEKIVELEIAEKPSSRSKYEYFRELQMLERLGPPTTASEQRMLEYRRAAMQGLLFDEELFHRSSKSRETPTWFKEARKRVSIRLIETQRIITAKERGGESYVNRVTKSAKELAELIAEIDKVASQTATELDGTFPNRLVRKLRQGENDSFEDLNTALSELDDRRKKLSSLGLLEVTGDTDILRVDEGQRDLSSALKLYIDDSHKKLAPYDAIASKLELFKGIVNKRFKHKMLEVDRNSGFVFRSTIKRNEKGKAETIPPLKLSSGEQNELILFYELIFKSAKGDLIFIDEPEVSLHISWQNKFIDDLKEITSINNVSIVIATHSPDIIGENWDLKVEIKGVE
jgi:predicted ATP-binding protein involved in virulence